MAIDSRRYLAVVPYIPAPPPTAFSGLLDWLARQVQYIATTLSQLAEGMPQAADAAPANPRIGTQRLAVMPWNPLGTGRDTWVWWNGTAWVAL